MVLPAIFIWGLARYRAPIDPFILMLAAVGIVAIAGRLRPGGSAARVHGVHAGAQDGA
jgi:hypothetical protein